MIFQHPLPPVPASLTRVQFLLVADIIGYNEESIENLITNDATLSLSEKRGLIIRFRAAREFPRDWPHLEMLAQDFTSSEIDDLYRYGATL